MQASSLLIDAIEKATQEVFETMLGAKITLEPESSKPVDADVVSFVGLTGNWSGTGTISCSPAVARLVAIRMLMLEEELVVTVDDEVLDAIAELTNMVVGNVKNLLTSELGDMALSIPTVVYGKNFRFKHFPGMSQVAAIFRFEDHRFEVKLCLAPTFSQTPHPRNRPAVPQTV